jgi:hypothetical protein
MHARARKKDPSSSHGAVRDLFDTGIGGRQQLAASRLVQENPGLSYLKLFEIHQEQSKRAGNELVFRTAVALMRRLSEVASRGELKFCAIANRKILSWYPR